MALMLNIGLKTSAGGRVPVLRAIDAVERELGGVLHWAVRMSDTEPTLVAEVINHGGARAALYRIAEVLGQDCVAVYSPLTKRGALIGPRACAWGDFNPAYFVLLDGSRLADQEVQA